MLSDLVFRLRSLFRRNTVEAELDDEVFIALSPLTEWSIVTETSGPERSQ